MTYEGCMYFPDEAARAAEFDALAAQIGERMKKSDADLIAEYVRLGALEAMIEADCVGRGVGREKSNGRQSYRQDNKSFPLLIKYSEQRRKIFQALGLIAGPGRATAADEDDDEFEDF